MLNLFSVVFFFNDTATTEIYTLSLHDALPISEALDLDEDGYLVSTCRSKDMIISGGQNIYPTEARNASASAPKPEKGAVRSEEHTSELQSRQYLVCRLLLEKKKKHK